MPAYQYLVSEKKANLISNAVAVALTLALPRVYVLLKRSIPSLLEIYRQTTQYKLVGWLQHATLILLKGLCTRTLQNGSGSVSDRAALELSSTIHPYGETEDRILTGALATIQDSTTAEDAVSRLARRHLAMPKLTLEHGTLNLHSLRRTFKNIIEEPGASAYIVLLMLLLIAVYVGIQMIATSSSFILGDSSATIRNGACAYYVTGRWSNNWEILDFSAHNSHQSSLTESALNYASACYQSGESTSRCPVAQVRTISHNISRSNSCPFPNKAMCKISNSSVFNMDSGFVNAHSLGINSARNFEFRRRTACSPVIDNDTFVQIHKRNEEEATIRYVYDSKVDGNMTFGEVWCRDCSRLLGDFSESDHNIITPDVLRTAYDVL